MLTIFFYKSRFEKIGRFFVDFANSGWSNMLDMPKDHVIHSWLRNAFSRMLSFNVNVVRRDAIKGGNKVDPVSSCKDCCVIYRTFGIRGGGGRKAVVEFID